MAWCLAAGVCANAPALAAAPQKMSAKQRKARTSQVQAELTSGSPERILAALSQIQEEADPEYAPLLLAVFERGPSQAIALATMSAAESLKAPSLSAAVAPYVKHRSAQLRSEAAKALVASGGPVALSALREGLRSSDARVRGIAASGLGELGDARAVPDLFLALDHNVAEAAVSLGQLCANADCLKLADKLGRAQFVVITAGLEQVLFRQDPTVNVETKVDVVQRIGSLQTKEAGKFLVELRERWPKEQDPKVTKALQGAIRLIQGRAE